MSIPNLVDSGTTPILSSDWPNILANQSRTQDEFNSTVNKRFSDVRQYLLSLKTDSDNNSILINNNKNNIDSIQKQVNSLLNQINDIQNGWNDLQTDNAQFKSNVNTTISGFQNLLNVFQGDITSLWKQVNKNTSDISEIRTLIDPDLIKSSVDAWNNAQKAIKDAIENYDKTTIQPIINSINTKISDSVNSINSDINIIRDDINTVSNNYSELSNQLNKLASNLQAGINTNSDAITNELKRATNTENSLKVQIDAETTRATTAEDLITSNYKQADSSIRDSLGTEITNREIADTSIRNDFAASQTKQDQDLKNYTNEQVLSTLQTAKQYADNGDESTRQKANSYTDDKFKTTIDAVQNAVGAANGAVGLASQALSATNANKEIITSQGQRLDNAEKNIKNNEENIKNNEENINKLITKPYLQTGKNTITPISFPLGNITQGGVYFNYTFSEDVIVNGIKKSKGEILSKQGIMERFDIWGINSGITQIIWVGFDINWTIASNIDIIS